ncbi:flagellin [Agrobacterium larrymoorei]|uniref:flagellin N-terminal helical domain-containing protein n=1 Tax=Agrobacterium larrymoorei TaxID=160699 RepID=UPI001573F8ED|nr:flagellin [Agrobacterium larrymoorei]NTJ41346.1 flagellin [Agrobacterium larrymoorei]
MSSINFNSSATTALQTLREINKDLNGTQNRVSTGLKVGSAGDNAAYWSIATTMKSDNKALGAASDSLGVGAAKVDTAYAAMESAIDVVNEIKAKLTTASESSVNKDQVNLEIGKLQEQLSAIAQASSFNGENWTVQSTGSTTTVVDGFIRNTDGTVEVTTAEFDSGTYALFSSMTNGTGDGGILDDVMDISISSASTQTNVDSFLDDVQTALDNLTDGASALGALSKRIDLQESFAGKISDAIEKGVSRLVDADMEEESARLSALQTQQQLAIQSLSIANSSSQNIMSLFR